MAIMTVMKKVKSAEEVKKLKDLEYEEPEVQARCAECYLPLASTDIKCCAECAKDLEPEYEGWVGPCTAK